LSLKGAIFPAESTMLQARIELEIDWQWVLRLVSGTDPRLSEVNMVLDIQF
jgi:hypothetical protein